MNDQILKQIQAMKIEQELKEYVNDKDNSTLLAVLDGQESMGLINKKEALMGVSAFMMAFSMTLSKGFVDYYKRVLAVNPNLKTILNYHVWCLDIFQNIVLHDKHNGEMGLNIEREYVEKLCKEYHHPNDFI